MASLLASLLISLFLFFYDTTGVVAGEAREFDYFVLTLQWPGSICQRSHHCCSSNACCRGSAAPTEFTIHGLWPDYNDGTWPACCSGSSFDPNKISTLVETLERYWPSLSCSSPSDCHGGKGSFWEHEWEKHGTCSFPVVKDEYSYFSTTLDLYYKYNVTQILNHAGFLPDNYHKYRLVDVVTTITKAVGASPLLVCSHGAVEELRMCFYKDFKPRDCIMDLNAGSKSSCPTFISLPENRLSNAIHSEFSGLKKKIKIGVKLLEILELKFTFTLQLMGLVLQL